LWIAALVIQTAFMIGITLTRASVTPFIPDVEDLVSLITRAGLFPDAGALRACRVQREHLAAVLFKPAFTG
jgi:hypothetical protein